MKLNFPHRHLTLFTISAFLLALPAPAQVGGGLTEQYQIDGPTQGGRFGSSAASLGDVNGDGIPDFIVGAPETDIGGAQHAGSAHVYSGADGTLLHEVQGSVQSERLGESVSGLGDINQDGFDDFMVGAPGATIGGIPNMGTVTVYSGVSGGLLLQIVTPVQSALFGKRISGTGDVNGDGFPDILIGATHTSPNGVSSAGSAFVYSGSTGALLFQFDGTIPHENYGSSVGEAGDVNQDGFDDILIGASGTDPGILNGAGSAFVYSGFDASLLLRFDGEGSSDRMGTAVAGNRDITGDGIPDFLVGAAGWADGFGASQGAVYVFSGNDGRRLFRYRGQRRNMGLGHVVSFAGDINRDGYNDFFLGAPSNDANGIDSAGSGFLYAGATGELLHRFEGSSALGLAGASFAQIGDLHADGSSSFLIAASNENQLDGLVSVLSFDPYLTTSAYRLSRTTGGTVSINIDFPDSEANAQYGLLLSRSGAESSGFRGGTIPLVQDVLFQQVASGWTPPFMSNNFGILDANGNATATFTLLPNSPPALIDTRRWFSAVTLMSGSGDMSAASIAVPLKIIP